MSVFFDALEVVKLKNMSGKIRKLLMALQMQGHIYFVNKEQYYNKNAKKVCTIHKLYKSYTAGDKQKKELICKSSREIEILLTLANIYKGGGGDG